MGDLLTGVVTAALARGATPLEAMDTAKRCVTRAIAEPAVLRDRARVAEALAALYSAGGMDATPIEVEGG